MGTFLPEPELDPEQSDAARLFHRAGQRHPPAWAERRAAFPRRYETRINSLYPAGRDLTMKFSKENLVWTREPKRSEIGDDKIGVYACLKTARRSTSRCTRRAGILFPNGFTWIKTQRS